MTTFIISSIACILGIISPVMFLYALKKGLNASGLSDTSKFYSILVFGVLIWVVIIFYLTVQGIFAYQEGDVLPRFLIALFIPVLIMLAAMSSHSFREVLNHTPMHWLVGSQFFRLFGIVFFLVAAAELGPQSFVSSGYGDLATGALAIVAALMLYRQARGANTMAWAFNIVGMLDLLNVSFILLANYPIWSNATPSTAAAGMFPLMLIVGITAPVALLLHIYTIRALLLGSRSRL